MTRTPAEIQRLIGHLQTLSRVPGQKPKNISEWAAEAADALAPLAAERGEVAGWKLVPVETTQEMRLAGSDVHDQRPSEVNAVYAAMLAASPAPPAPAAMPGVDLEGALNLAARRMQRIGTAGSEEDIEGQLRPYFQPLAQENERLKDALWQARWDLVTNNGYDNNDPTIVQINAALPPENK